MAERLVDVMDGGGTVIHTYPITLGDLGDNPDDAAYLAKALEAAAHGRLVPDSELEGLTAKIHFDRGGQMAPYGDDVASGSETKVDLMQSIQELAYVLWEQDGSPEGRSDEYWHRAVDQHLRERAYVMWVQAGRPEGGADEYWRRIREFEAQ
jgi:Protein of unknown function (DUF2934)